MSTIATTSVRQRVTREPVRRERILAAAASLVAARGYHAVSMAEIGAASGITAPAIYRHFDGKSALLVALFDRAIDGLLDRLAAIVDGAPDALIALARLVDEQVEFVVDDRVLAQVYYSEIHNLPAEDSRRLRRKQRRYVDAWAELVVELRPDRSRAEARTEVHAAIGAVQSVLFHAVALDEQQLRSVLTRAAGAVLGLTPGTGAA